MTSGDDLELTTAQSSSGQTLPRREKTSEYVTTDVDDSDREATISELRQQEKDDVQSPPLNEPSGDCSNPN